ncbi:hypothetical protein C7B62_12200 [Pleurocapsa sp. CCALA 161]|uniref:hypothetical protein n=1 Tax=Pleurocapsa sp. CCALA 161 TaxID=2107688 RepID=UPI000D06B85D|nr:hypothetical protein [Pleurocapsa sp. CCALA 161]PSB09722.1 hypothetical protein C7B62_12200 [Pleurocapsa sp. CCALA 161]
MIELLYLASQIQCGAGGSFLNIQVDVYHQEQLVKTMKVNERALIPVGSVNDLDFQYTIIDNNTRCNLRTPTEMALTPDSQLPNIAGVYEQDSVKTLLSGLNNYEELFLVELGTTDRNSPAFDMQDVILKVDNNPTSVTIYPD